MAVNLISVSGILCERILEESGPIYSAIRIVDIFGVSGGQSDVVQFTGLVFMKAMPTEEKFRVGVVLEDPDGKKQQLPDPPDNPFSFPVYEGDPTIPVGFALVLQIRIQGSKTGTFYVEVSVDGTSRIRLPFTIRLLPVAQQNAQ